MSATDAEIVQALMAAIDRYLQGHPLAADNPAGIRTWWLPQPLDQEPIERVEEALERLVELRQLQREESVAGRILYRRMTDPGSRRAEP